MKTCSIDDCTNSHYAKTLCNKHYLRLKIHGDPHFVMPRGLNTRFKPGHKVPSGSSSHNWKGSDITYWGAHARVRYVRGPAKNYACIDCQRPALEWSYNHSDPEELRQDGHGPFSSNPNFYEPRCKPCHTDFDTKRVKVMQHV